MGIFEVIEEQAIIGFSGKINFQSKVDGHFIGSIFLLDGKICNCHFDKTQEIKAMVSLYIYLAENNEFQVILEPEIIAIHQSKIDIPISRIKKLCEDSLLKYNNTKSHRPPDHIRLMINESIFESNLEISASEYKLLCTISDNSLVKDIYRECKLLDFEITHHLIELRKKDVLKVVQSK